MREQGKSLVVDSQAANPASSLRVKFFLRNLPFGKAAPGNERSKVCPGYCLRLASSHSCP